MLLKFAVTDDSLKSKLLSCFKRLLGDTSPYDYEQLRFLLNAVDLSEPMEHASKVCELELIKLSYEVSRLLEQPLCV